MTTRRPGRHCGGGAKPGGSQAPAWPPLGHRGHNQDTGRDTTKPGRQRGKVWDTEGTAGTPAGAQARGHRLGHGPDTSGTSPRQKPGHRQGATHDTNTKDGFPVGGPQRDSILQPSTLPRLHQKLPHPLPEPKPSHPCVFAQSATSTYSPSKLMLWKAVKWAFKTVFAS